MAFDEDDYCCRCCEHVERHGWCGVVHRHTCWTEPCPTSHTECENHP